MPIDESKAMKEVRLMKEKIWEKMKNMSPEEQIAYERSVTESLINEYGLKVKRIPDSQA